MEKKVAELQGKMQQKAAVVQSQLTHPPIADLDMGAERRGRYLELYTACAYALLHTTGIAHDEQHACTQMSNFQVLEVDERSRRVHWSQSIDDYWH